MITKGWMKMAALALGAGLVFVARVSAGPGPMQVEEPAVSGTKPPIQPEKDQESWKARKKAGLTPAQLAALKTRQQTMKDMMVLIQQKRRAIKDARPEEREALAMELHNLIIEKGLVTDRLDRGPGRLDAKREGSGEAVSAADAGEGGKAVRLREERPAAETKERQWESREDQRRGSKDDRWNQWDSRGNSRGNGSDDD